MEDKDIIKGFFYEEDFELFKKYAGKSSDEFPEAHNVLKETYLKLGQITDALNKTQKYKCDIRKNPLNQGQKFADYHWSRIYPIDLCGSCWQKVFFVISTNENGFNIHIHSYTSKGYLPNDAAKKIIDDTWNVTDIEDIIECTFEMILSKIENYICDNMYNFLLFGKEFGIEECIKRLNIMEMEKDVKFLESCKNLILTGAPGTGKTYQTAEIALQLIGKTDIDFSDRNVVMEAYKQAVKDGFIAFITFHQSLDYEEFIEGLKPVLDENDNEKVSYKVKPGIFKEICDRANKNFIQSFKTIEELDKEQNIKNFVDVFLSEAVDKNSDFETTFHKIKYWITGVDDDWIQIRNGNFNNREYEPKRTSLRISYIELLKILESSTKYNNKNEISSALKRQKKHPGDNYLYSVYSEIFDSLQKKITDTSSGILKVEQKNYVLIIDEINRGNISKIFGELITLLEKDKRLGEINEITVTLPYSQKAFGVPSNLYIIGTMNTADRSIGHIDYALRRRFTFIPVIAKRIVIENYNQYSEDTKQKALNLFDIIKEFITEKINEDIDAEDLMIGHSYFLCKTNDDLKSRLEFEIIPLIKEYEKDGIIMVDKSELKKKFEEWKALI